MIDTLLPNWAAPANVRAVTTLRHAGVSEEDFASANLAEHVNDDPARVRENRRRLRIEQRLPAEPAWLNQVHGTVIAKLDTGGVPASADGAVTRRADAVCVVLTADCVPVLLCTEDGGCVAAAHAGWRGLAAGVVDAAVGAMAEPADRVIAWLGPAIGPQAFEVGMDVFDAFCSNDSAASAAFTARGPGKFLADLRELARQRLLRLGVSRISVDTHCTYTDERHFFSYRRAPRTGRQATLIWRTA